MIAKRKKLITTKKKKRKPPLSPPKKRGQVFSKEETERRQKNKKSGWFKPGVSGNPNGRPPGVKFLSESLRDHLEHAAASIPGIKAQAVEMDMNPDTNTIGEVLMARVIWMASNGEGSALSQLLDRVEGKVLERVEASLSHGILGDKSDKELKEIVKRSKQK